MTGVISSLRSKVDSAVLKNILNDSKTYDDIYNYIYQIAGDRRISNSEALLVMGLFSTHECGIDLRILNLKDHFNLDSVAPKDPSALLSAINESDGLLISTPVYFGDRTSLVADFLRYCNEQNTQGEHLLDNKAVGAISVGAKRNGGQETTNIYTLYDCLSLGATIVGNGPPTSQYGGTGFAGNLGAIIDDNFGLTTSRGTGQRIASLVKLLNTQKSMSKIRILFVVTRKDRSSNYLKRLENMPFSGKVETSVLDLGQLSINRCLACSICPNSNHNGSYTCVINPDYNNKIKDDMPQIHTALNWADCIVVAHYNGHEADKDMYQSFMERTRFMRRHNFELADKIFSAMTETNDLYDIYHLRFMTSFLRHNMYLVGPFQRTIQVGKSDSKIYSISDEEFCARLESVTKKAVYNRVNSGSKPDYAYDPIGYI